MFQLNISTHKKYFNQTLSILSFFLVYSLIRIVGSQINYIQYILSFDYMHLYSNSYKPSYIFYLKPMYIIKGDDICYIL